VATYVNNLRLKEIATGDESGTWGVSTNTNLELIADSLGYGTQDCFSTDANSTTTVPDGSADPSRAMYFKVTSSATLTTTRELTIAPNTISRVMIIENATTGSQSIEISQGSGANVTIPTGEARAVYLDGAGATAAVVDTGLTLADGTQTLTNKTISADNNTISGIAASSFVLSDGSGNVDGSAAQKAIPAGDVVGTSDSQVLTGKTLTSPIIGTDIQDTNSNELINITATASAVNEFTLNNAATGNNPAISASGNDTNVGIDLTPKGTGEVDITASFLTGIFSDKVVAIGNTSTAKTIDTSTGSVFTATLTGNCTFTLGSSNQNSSRATSFTLILTNDATPSRTVAFAGGTVEFPQGAVARTTDANATDIWFFMSPDNGTTWYASIPMKNLS
tara:strand:- start:5356 stop:6534 length:1179 start_codon:yes stop_codon:yes gene_type:complete